MGAYTEAELAAFSRRFDLTGTVRAHEKVLSLGRVRLVVRLEGGLISLLEVDGVPVLPRAATGLIQPGKLNATITMGPPGPNKTGTDHGNWRRTVYVVTGSGTGWLELTAYDPDRRLLHVKTFLLLENGVQLTDRFVNLGDPAGQGMGEHYYVATAGMDALDSIRILDEAGADLSFTGRLESGRDLTGTLAAFVPELRLGKTVSVAGFGESLLLYIRDVGRLLLTASAFHEGEALPIDWWAWHRDGTATNCFEPVAGTSLSPAAEVRNDLIWLGHNESMQLISTVRRLGR